MNVLKKMSEIIEIKYRIDKIDRNLKKEEQH